MKNILIVAGEASGEMYGAALAREILARDPEWKIWGCGGDRMEAEGVDIVYPIREFSVLGFSEVVRRIPFFLGALERMRSLVEERKPAVTVLIDFPGFNMKLAKRTLSLGSPIVYYVSPQVWAWGWKRVRELRELVRKMLVILPFEEEIYRENGVPVSFVGHPLVDIAKPSGRPDEFRARHRIGSDEPLVGLFPGSRKHEVELLLPPMVETIRRLRREGFPVRAMIGAAPTVEDEFYRGLLAANDLPVVRDETYDLLGASLFALVASGTMTVEAACLGAPMAILYRVSLLSWMIGKRLVKVPHIGMANILAGERAVPEFLQKEASADRLTPLCREWLSEPEILAPIREKLLAVRDRLGGGGASGRAAEEVLAIAEERR